MSALDIVLIALAGLWAGAINVAVGSGSLVTFPTLVALGFPPVTASISNAMGLIAGNFSGALSYRRELREVRPQLLRLIPASLAGGLVGSSLLLHLPPSVFNYVAPVLTVLAVLCVLFQPRLARAIAARREAAASASGSPPDAVEGTRITPVTAVLVFLAGIYGGYFVAAQGVLLLAILGILVSGIGFQRSNGLRNVLVLVVNMTAAASYLLFAFERIRWDAVLVIAVSSFVGGTFGGRVARRLSASVLRGTIVVFGCIALVTMIGKLL
ncbi:sulfite exporter TauE/SafE family protein [Falsarthrobacter nasiphocae]|uniref:Probable membrane transporter protein n=1 Tax=Falsarthrobacter nasiphocae TaxID=189863 RepID=A0AAE4C758_9MICC|nr:sulfite exporter TauE/SafE family protein [Falsarthrobacter nasiphocae]MDR6891130.1 putative membrane protein YfcA [Falsarthrobacter nasiphocae]